MRLFARTKPNLPERRRASVSSISSKPERQRTSLFSRGRTLTGSVSSLVSTPGESQADLKSPRVHAHTLARKRRHLGIIFVAVALVALFFFLLVSQFTAHAVVVPSPDSSLQLDKVYAESIDTYLTEHVSQRWRVLTNTDQLTAYLQQIVPEVESVELKGSAGFGESLFAIRFRQPIASWDIGSKQLYVDANGVPFSRNYFASPRLRISDQSGLAATTGQTVMSNRFMGFIGQVIGFSKQQEYVVTDIVIPPNATRQIDIRLKGVEYPVKFSSDRSAREGVSDMVAALQWMKGRQLTPEYIDVRVGGRVFYK